MDNNVTFKRVKSIVFGKKDEDLFNSLNKSGYFDKNWNSKIKELIKSDLYGSILLESNSLQKKLPTDISIEVRFVIIYTNLGHNIVCMKILTI